MPVEPVFNWYQMSITMEVGFITGLSIDPGFIDATADQQYGMGVSSICMMCSKRASSVTQSQVLRLKIRLVHECFLLMVTCLTRLKMS